MKAMGSGLRAKRDPEERRGSIASSVLRAACLAVGGMLTLGWVGILGLGAYNVTWWIIGW
jgi:hypothetical protein